MLKRSEVQNISVRDRSLKNIGIPETIGIKGMTLRAVAAASPIGSIIIRAAVSIVKKRTIRTFVMTAHTYRPSLERNLASQSPQEISIIAD